MIDVAHNVVLLLSISIGTFAETEVNFEGHLTDWFVMVLKDTQESNNKNLLELNRSEFFTYIFLM